MSITQSRRNLTRFERTLTNRMVGADLPNDRINRLLVSIQETKDLPLRLMSDGYLNRIRSQYRLFRQVLELGCPEAAQYGIDMLEAGYSWSGTDSNHVAHHLKPDAVDELRQIYLTQDGEATR